jgi:hypothetical protein
MLFMSYLSNDAYMLATVVIFYRGNGWEPARAHQSHNNNTS